MQDNYTTKRQKGKHLTYIERNKIEALVKAKTKTKEIAKIIGASVRTIQRELKRGQTEQLDSFLNKKIVYSAYKSQCLYDKKVKNKQFNLKIDKNIELSKAIEYQIVFLKKSPYAALNDLKKEFDVNICLKTLYNYIHGNLFIQLNDSHLPYKKKRKKKIHKYKSIKKIGGTSIEKRSDEINSRLELGHWEMDTVVGLRAKGEVILVLTERVSRKEILTKLKSKSADEVTKALMNLKKKYKKKFNKIFKTITTDNGSEFMLSEEIEKLGVKHFYAHSYCSWESRSNENNNKLIRRFIPKGTSISKFSEKKIKEIETFMNNYPRAMFGGKTSNEIYEIEFKKEYGDSFEMA